MMEAPRRGDWIQTVSGRQFWPLDPRPDEIDIGDIAHALGAICRFNGHSRRFYSVAEHCVLMSREVPGDYALEALLHDATEAYLCDLSRPVKRCVTGYKEVEDTLDRIIRQKFGLPAAMSPVVKEADTRMLATEARQAMGEAPCAWRAIDRAEPFNTYLRFWGPQAARNMFMARFRDLTTPNALAAARSAAPHGIGGERGGAGEGV